MSKDYIAVLKMRIRIILVIGALLVVTMSSVQGAPVGDTWYVDSRDGDDLTGTGTSFYEPFKTITHALNVAASGDTILVKGGDYDAANGEVFPIEMKRGVDIKGIPRAIRQDFYGRIFRGMIMPGIRGGASYAIPGATRFVSVLGADDASISRFRFIAISGSPDISGTSILCDSTSPIILNNSFTGEGGHAGITTLGNAHPTIRINNFTGGKFSSRSLNWGITVYGESYPMIKCNNFSSCSAGGVDCTDHSHPTIDGNTFSSGNIGISTKGWSNPTIVNNTIAGNELWGIVIRMSSTPMIQDNVITDNPTGIFIAMRHSPDTEPEPEPEPDPDIGGGGRSHGGNTFINNTDWDLENWCGNDIMARDNQWSSYPCVDCIDANDIYDDDEDALSGAVDFSTRFGWISAAPAWRLPRGLPWRLPYRPPPSLPLPPFP